MRRDHQMAVVPPNLLAQTPNEMSGLLKKVMRDPISVIVFVRRQLSVNERREHALPQFQVRLEDVLEALCTALIPHLGGGESNDLPPPGR
mmetsp:Transcript_29185/g.64350  ORF Transcript_29185/g.64350 Transcript_29185/m.64350 type:complete len:90 (-) Transcript_29185:1125-1394(-)